MELTVSVWNDRSKNDRDIVDPSWEQVKAALAELLEPKFVDVLLAGEDEAYLAISGDSGKNTLFIWTADERSLLPYNASVPDEEVSVVSGGQRVYWNRRHLVTIEEAEEIAQQYYETGLPAPGVEWVEE